MVRHVKDLSSAYFALSDKMLLFTIEKIEGTDGYQYNK